PPTGGPGSRGWRTGTSFRERVARERVRQAVGGVGGLEPRRWGVWHGAAVAGGPADPRAAGGVGGELRRGAAVAAVRPAERGPARPVGPAARDVGGRRRAGRGGRRAGPGRAA